MIVTMPVVAMMQHTIGDVIQMIAMRNFNVLAMVMCAPTSDGLAGIRICRIYVQSVLVIMIAVLEMKMAIVKKVDMAIVSHQLMTAPGGMFVAVR